VKILYVLPQLPFPADRGGKRVTYNQIEYMRRRHEVSVIAMTHGTEDVDAAANYRERVKDLWTYPCPPRYGPGVRLRGLVSSSPVKALRFWNREMARTVEALCRDGGFDLVDAHFHYAAQYVPKDCPPGTVHSKHNFEGLLLERCAHFHPNPVMRAAFRSQSRRTHRFELEVARRFDRVYTLTRTDLNRLREAAPDLAVEYHPATIDTEACVPSEADPVPGEMVFVGTLDYFPNVDGLLWFAREVLPLLRRTRQDIRLVVVGHRADSRLAELRKDPVIRFTGRVEDVAPHIQRASVYVAPLRIGGGVRLKILEAMAFGKAIVTTPVGCEGIECAWGEDLRVAEDPGGFAEQVLDLLAHPDRRISLERNARKQVEMRYSMPVVLPKVEESYLQVVSGKKERLPT
jgi:glycosyltransferase involved in cell wall biosynthesis